MSQERVGTQIFHSGIAQCTCWKSFRPKGRAEGNALSFTHSITCRKSGSPCRNCLGSYLDKMQTLFVVCNSTHDISIVTGGGAGGNRPHCLHGSLKTVERASALQCLLPGRCSMVKSYSARISSHRATCPCDSLKFRNHCKELRSVRTIKRQPQR